MYNTIEITSYNSETARMTQCYCHFGKYLWIGQNGQHAILMAAVYDDGVIHEFFNI